MKDWKKIQSEIRDALSGHDAKVEYHAKRGSGHRQIIPAENQLNQLYH